MTFVREGGVAAAVTELDQVGQTGRKVLETVRLLSRSGTAQSYRTKMIKSLHQTPGRSLYAPVLTKFRVYAISDLAHDVFDCQLA